MSEQPEALRPAIRFGDACGPYDVSAELRRLHAENEQLRVALEKETAARREAQIQLAAAYEARNRAGIEFRRLAAKENAELVEALRAELAEQARLNGMGSEREARLLALNAELVEALRQIANVNAMDHEYQQWARAALAKAEEGR